MSTTTAEVTQEPSKDITLDWHYSQSPEEVYHCLTTSELIEKWLMPNNFKAEVGHQFQFRSKPMPGWCGIVECKVLELDPNKKVKYTWVSGPEAGSKEVDTTVTWLLESENGGTHLTLEHSGFKGEKAVFSASMMEQGWNSGIAKSFARILEEYTQKG